MKLNKYTIGTLFLIQLFAAPALFAEKVLFVHGMSLTESNADCQDQLSCDYWSTVTPAVGDYTIVGYDGRKNPFVATPTAGSVRLLEMLNKYCRADQGQSCRIVADSLGGFTTAGTVAMYNTTGVYNILNSTQIVSAEGGSEIANLGDGAIDVLKVVLGIGYLLENAWGAVEALVTTNARGLFDHNRNNGTMFYHVAARKSVFIAAQILPGKDDSLVAFHSACGYRTTGGFKKCMGQKIRDCGWCFWQKREHIDPWEGHFMHPANGNKGVKMRHAPTHNEVEFHTLAE